MNIAAIYHVSEYIYAYAVSPTTLRVRLRTGRDDFEGCRVFFKNVYDHTPAHNEAPMEKIRTEREFDWYEADLELRERRFKYYFRLEAFGGETVYYTSDGAAEELSSPVEYFFVPYLFDEEVPSHPEWAKGSLIYQIFLDRFCNGDPSNDPPAARDWNALPDNRTFYGGDIRGVVAKLGYIHSLGARAIYLNPLFKSDTYHKYDIRDYYAIDPAYGTKEDLKELVGQAHSLGIKVILDAVFNHCSDSNPLFDDVRQNGRESRYADWFDIFAYPVTKNPPSYDSFAGLVPEMPRFNTSNPEVADYLITSAEYWTKYLDIDGWRLDVADEVSHRLWREFNRRLKAVKPELLILGEIWNQSTRWLMGDECDTATNYKFRKAVLEFARSEDMTNEQLWDMLAHNEMKYKTTTLPVLVNLVGSHDTMRLKTALKENGRLARVVLGVMLTYTGMPLIYYGDEIGLSGGDDPDNRRTMKWESGEWDRSTFGLVRALSAARQQSRALSVGELTEIRAVPGRVFAYKRTFGTEQAYVFANFGNQQADILMELGTDAPGQAVNLADGRTIPLKEQGRIRLAVPPEDIAVIAVSN